MYKIRCLIYSSIILFLIAGCNQGQNKNDSGYPVSSGFVLSESEIPDFEKDLDHRGLVEALGDRQEESLRKGEHIYNNICFNCHGNHEQEDSLPTAFKFWKDTFKVGGDPFSIYQTLTRGYGSMPPQTNITPGETYDIIHYIRETF